MKPGFCLTIMFAIIGWSSNAQKTSHEILHPLMEKIATPESRAGWIKFKETVNIDPKNIFVEYQSEFNLAENDAMVLVRTDKDELGSNHYRFQQFYQHVKVEGGEYIVHCDKTGVTYLANGKIITGLDMSIVPALQPAQIIDLALQHLNTGGYLWDSPFWENELKEKTGNADTSYYPVPQLVITKLPHTQNWSKENFILAYRVDIYSEKTATRLFMSANTGEFIKEIPLELNCSATSVATVFNGTRTIYTALFNSEYRLMDDCQDAFIHIRDWNSSTTTANPEEITSAANSWTNTNQRFGASVLWSVKQAYNYFLEVHSRESYDNNNSPINGYINAVFDAGGGNYYTDNATMSVTGGTMKIGLGSAGTLADSYGTLDIVCHEYGHALTGSTAELIYEDESGALNESFSDIFGEVIEHYTLGDNDWLIGADKASGAIRSLMNPNAGDDPDTYEGTNWYLGSDDNGGVHTNSGVQNFWFYLLANGGSGTNDHGESYSVNGIGMVKARAIAYRNLVFNLTSTADYSAARYGSLQAAVDLYGSTSAEYTAVFNAWCAVGVSCSNPLQNDNCSGAISLAPHATCIYTNGTTVGASTSNSLPLPDCGDFSSENSKDVWFNFIATDNYYIIDSEPGTLQDGVMELYKGACSSLTFIECDDDDSQNGVMPMITRDDFEIGDIYYIRFWGFSDFSGTFGICLQGNSTITTNDDCATAITLSPGTICNYLSGTTTGANYSNTTPLPTCANYSSGISKDVWFKFVATGTGHTINSQPGTMTISGMALYSGSCTGLTLMECDAVDSPNGTMPLITRNDFIPGNTYYIRFWNIYSSNSGTFGICVTDNDIIASNDDCLDAIDLMSGSACAYIDVTNVGASTSTNTPSPDCFILFNDNSPDVWFKFVATSNDLTIDSETGSIIDCGMVLYSGDCSNLTMIECDDNDSQNGVMPMITRNDFVVGNTYYIRMGCYYNTGTFGIRIQENPFIPVSDECTDAIDLPIYYAYSYIQGTTTGATFSSTTPYPGCANFDPSSPKDVWFKFTAIKNALTINCQSGTINDGGMALYSGSCGGLTLIECDEDDSPVGPMPLISRTDFIEGDTYYIRFWSEDLDESGSFNIGVKYNGSFPPSDECVDAILLTPGTTCSYTAGTTFAATNSSNTPLPDCADFDPGVSKDAWFVFTATGTEQIIASYSIGSNYDGGMALYSGTCTDLTLIECNDDGMPLGSMPLITRSDFMVGNTYYIRFWHAYNNSEINFSVCVLDSTCIKPEATTVIGDGAYCKSITLKTCGGAGGNIYWQGTNSNGTSLSNIGTAHAVNVSGTYYFRSLNACGWGEQDSAIVDITIIDTSITVDETTLISNATPALYQWISCPTLQHIFGATDQSYTPTHNGSYALIINQNGCTSTTYCYEVTTTGIESVINESTFSVYPNPTNNIFTLKAAGLLDKKYSITLINPIGQTLSVATLNNYSESFEMQFDVHEFPSGLYFLAIRSENMSHIIKIEKQ